MSNLNFKFAASDAEILAQLNAARARASSSGAGSVNTQQAISPRPTQAPTQPVPNQPNPTASAARTQTANVGTVRTQPSFDINNPGAYGKLLGQGFSTAGMYDVESPQAKSFMQSSGFNNAQYAALRSAAQRARSGIMQGARSGDFSAINPANILTPEEQSTLTPQTTVNVPMVGEVDPNKPFKFSVPFYGEVNTGIVPSNVAKSLGYGPDQDAIKAQIAEAAKGEIMTRDNPYVRNLLAQASVPYMENKFKQWFGDETAIGRGAQSIGNLIMGLLSKIPGYETIVNKGVDWFNPELLSSMGIKTSSAKLPPYFHYAVIGKFAGNDILQKVTKELN